MQIIEVKGKKWVVGLEWETLPGEKSTKLEAKDSAEKTKSNFGILIDYDEQFAIGLSKKSSNLPSAATYLALANQAARNTGASDEYTSDWIVVEEVSDDKFWIGVVKNGIPSPQADSVLDITAIKDIIMALLMHDTYRLFSTCGEIKAIFGDLKTVEEISINTLTEDVKNKIKFTKLKGIPNSLIYAGFGLMLLIVAGVGISSLIEGQNMKEKMANIEKQRMQEEVAKQQKYAADLQKYEEAKKEAKRLAVNNILSGMSATPSYMLKNWYNVVGNIELGTHGWKLENIECYLIDATVTDAQKSACDIKFTKSDLSTNRMLLQEYPDALIKGNEAVITKLVPLDKSSMLAMKEEDITGLPTTRTWGADMISQLQLLKTVDIEHTIQPSIDIVFKAPPKPVDPKTNPAPNAAPVNEGDQPVGVAKGQIIMKGSNIDLIKEVADNVQFTGVGARKATFQVQGLGIIAWEVTLDYFVRPDQTGGIAGSNSSGIVNDAVPVANGAVTQQAK